MFSWKCACGFVCGMALNQAYAGIIEGSSSQATASPTATNLFPRPEIRSMAPSGLTLKTQVARPDDALRQLDSIAFQTSLHESPYDSSLSGIEIIRHESVKAGNRRYETLLPDPFLIEASEEVASTQVGQVAASNAKTPAKTVGVKLVSRPAASGFLNSTSIALAAVAALAIAFAVIVIIDKSNGSFGVRQETV